jgi:hypothetical protein
MRSVSGAGDFQFALSLREVIWGVLFLKSSAVCRCDDGGTCRDHAGGGHHEVFNGIVFLSINFEFFLYSVQAETRFLIMPSVQVVYLRLIQV